MVERPVAGGEKMSMVTKGGDSGQSHILYENWGDLASF